MVDFFGNWIYEPNTPKHKKCDCDYIADKIVESEYQVETAIENLVYMILLHFDCCDNYGKYDEETGFGGYGEYFTLEECLRYVEESGGWKEFDYYC